MAIDTGIESCDSTGAVRPQETWVNSLSRLGFPGVMGDVFSGSNSFRSIRDEILAHSRGSPHIWLWWTQKPTRMLDFFAWTGRPVPRNFLLGTSVTSYATLSRLDALRSIPRATRFVSFDPLLGEITRPCWPCQSRAGASRRRRRLCGQCYGTGRALNLNGIDWVIVGGESRNGAPRTELSWAQAIRAHCVAANIKFCVKQSGGLSSTPDANDRNAKEERAR